MNLLIIADDESLESRVPDCSVDLLISCGDLPDATILAIARKCRCRQIFAVKGNHDSSARFPEPISDLHLAVRDFLGLRFGGFRGSWKYKPRGNYLFDEWEVDRALKTFPPVDVFVAHNSPRLVHDREDEVHLGFASFTDYIQRARPRLFLHGHQHENVETLIGTTRVIGTYGHRLFVLPQ